MGNPDRDPHGDPIPSADLVMPEDESTTLSKLQAEQDAVICRVHSKDAEFLKHLNELGLTIGARVKTLDVSRYDQIMRLQVRGRKEALALGPAITNRVYIELVK